MTKAEIVKTIALQTGISPREVATTIEAFMEEIRNSLADKKENVYLRGFGSFIVKHRAQKTARRKKATRWQPTSARRDCARTDTRASKHLLV